MPKTQKRPARTTTRRRAHKPCAYDHATTKRLSIPTEQTERDVDINGKEYHAPPVGSQEPHLQWDRHNLAPGKEYAHALHIREKLSPQDMITKLSKHSAQTKIFDSFNGFEPGGKYHYYNHRSKGNWQNRIIRGDSARVMATLLAHENYKGTVQTIIFDPPYGINFDSNFAPAMRDTNKSKNITPPGMLTKDPFTCEAYCDTWERGLDSYLDAIFHRLCLMRDLLADTGSIFLQIGSDNVHRMALLLDEVFKHENYVSTIMFRKAGGDDSKLIPEGSDFLLWYAKDKTITTYNQLYEPLSKKDLLKHMSSYAMIEENNGNIRSLSTAERLNPETIPSDCRLFMRERLTSQGPSKTRSGEYVWNKKTYPCPPTEHWRVSQEGLEKLNHLNRLVSSESKSGYKRLSWKRYENEVPGRRINNQWPATAPPQKMRYAVQTSDQIIQRCILMTSNPGDLVFDPTGGSGVTAVVAERYARRWVLVDSSPVSVATIRHCLAAQTYDWYLLQDSKEGSRMESKLGGIPFVPSNGEFTSDPSHGFVYKRYPYVSAGTLAQDKPVRPILIVDEPYLQTGVKRVTGPFTVESETSSYTMSLTDPKSRLTFAARIVEILEKNGIDLVDGKKHLLITNIESVPDTYPYTHRGIINGKNTAILIAPEFRAADNRLIHQAALHASRHRMDELVVVAFEFQPLDVVIPVKINVTKILMNRALQQKELDSSKINRSFVVIAEPRIKTHSESGGKWSVEIVGYLTYDPLSGSMVSGDSDDIDCWMVDTDYDKESFYAREVHFPNTKPRWAARQITTIEQMLGSNLDKNKWTAFTSLRSSPFSSETGRIAVKIITTSGDEMLKEIILKSHN